jgi:replication factor A1
MDGGSQASFESHTLAGPISGSGGSINRNEIRTIHQIKEDQLGMSDKADFFSLRATIMHIKADNILYPACPTPQCNKKVTETHEGWRCEKCDRCHEKPEYRSVHSPRPTLFCRFCDAKNLSAGTSFKRPSVIILVRCG